MCRSCAEQSDIIHSPTWDMPDNLPFVWFNFILFFFYAETADYVKMKKIFSIYFWSSNKLSRESAQPYFLFLLWRPGLEFNVAVGNFCYKLLFSKRQYFFTPSKIESVLEENSMNETMVRNNILKINGHTGKLVFSIVNCTSKWKC